MKVIGELTESSFNGTIEDDNSLAEYAYDKQMVKEIQELKGYFV